jgi:hypothetical protein
MLEGPQPAVPIIMLTNDIVDILSRKNVHQMLDRWHQEGQKGLLSAIIGIEFDENSRYAPCHRVRLKNDATNASATLAIVVEREHADKVINFLLEKYTDWIEEWERARGVIVLDGDDDDDESMLDFLLNWRDEVND